MKKKFKPISSKQFYEVISVNTEHQYKNYEDYFAPAIESIKDFAIGPYCWFILNNIQMKITKVSENIDSLTPFSKADWFGSFDFFIDFFHPDDQPYVLSATAFVAKMNMSGIGKDLKFNIYSRALDQNQNYRWILMQSPKQYNNANKEQEAALVVFYDLSHLEIHSMPLLSVIDFRNKEVQYFKHFDREIKKIGDKAPKITKREKEILMSMAQGLNTPQIAEKLFISHYTVENHKRNLRQKTQTKTSSQLIAYTMQHSLLLF